MPCRMGRGASGKERSGKAGVSTCPLSPCCPSVSHSRASLPGRGVRGSWASTPSQQLNTVGRRNTGLGIAPQPHPQAECQCSWAHEVPPSSVGENTRAWLHGSGPALASAAWAGVTQAEGKHHPPHLPSTGLPSSWESHSCRFSGTRQPDLLHS